MTLNVLDIGNDKPITIPLGTSSEEICKLLSTAGVKKVPVVDGDRVVGIISRSAVTHYLERRFLERTQQASLQ